MVNLESDFNEKLVKKGNLISIRMAVSTMSIIKVRKSERSLLETYLK